MRYVRLAGLWGLLEEAAEHRVAACSARVARLERGCDALPAGLRGLLLGPNVRALEARRRELEAEEAAARSVRRLSDAFGLLASREREAARKAAEGKEVREVDDAVCCRFAGRLAGRGHGP